jgi:hypothetical protein
MYFISLFKIIIKRDDGQDEIIRKCINFAEWARNGDAHPVSFNKFNVDIIKNMRFKIF